MRSAQPFAIESWATLVWPLLAIWGVPPDATVNPYTSEIRGAASNAACSSPKKRSLLGGPSSATNGDTELRCRSGSLREHGGYPSQSFLLRIDIMPAHAYWKGYLKISLVSLPVKAYTATSEA